MIGAYPRARLRLFEYVCVCVLFVFWHASVTGCSVVRSCERAVFLCVISLACASVRPHADALDMLHGCWMDAVCVLLLLLVHSHSPHTLSAYC